MWEFTWEMLFSLLLMIAGVALFLKQIEAREVANEAAKRLCRQQQVAFLDGTVSFQKLWPRRAKNGRLLMQRFYAFDYLPPMIDDIESSRKTGFIVLLGDKVESIGFTPEIMN